jgi:hypothetical protein
MSENHLNEIKAIKLDYEKRIEKVISNSSKE